MNYINRFSFFLLFLSIFSCVCVSAKILVPSYYIFPVPIIFSVIFSFFQLMIRHANHLVFGACVR